jgi:GntR family transcriptional regulator/MocR family aminotransferase
MRTAPRVAMNLLVRVDTHARDTLQDQISCGIRRAIVDGVLAPGTRLPSSRALALDLGVSRTTTVLAIEQLIAEGYLESRRGAGTFVVSELPDDRPRTTPHRLFRLRHPPLSRRGHALSAISPPGVRLVGPPRAFRVGVPALDLFPVATWSRLVSRRAKSVTLTHLDYSEPAGILALREALADHVTKRRGTRCTAHQVLVVAGAQRGIEQICRLLLDTGDAAVLEDPCYPGAMSALVSAGARIVPVLVDENGIDASRISADEGTPRLAYVTPSHQFPLGAQMSLARRSALLDWARMSNAWIVEDDYDSEFRYGARPVPCLHGLDRDGRVIYVGSFSKSLFPSLRLGFLIVPADVHPRLVAARQAADVHPPTLDQLVLADFIEAGHFDRHLLRMRAAYRERVDALCDAAERFCGGALRVRPVQTGLHAVADLEGADADDVFREALKRGVEVMPLSSYAVASPVANALVLGFGCATPDTLTRGMERLAAAIAAAQRAATSMRSEAG